jgi:gamma-glutamyltranspeptidase/glutathione hydrolase
MMNIIDHGMGMQEAISAPRLHCEANQLYIESRVAPETRERLAEMGHDVIPTSDYLMYFGGANGILSDKEGWLHGGSDPRRIGFAIGYSE